MEINWMRESSAFSPSVTNATRSTTASMDRKRSRMPPQRGESLDLNMVDWRPTCLHEWGVAHARLALAAGGQRGLFLFPLRSLSFAVAPHTRTIGPFRIAVTAMTTSTTTMGLQRVVGRLGGNACAVTIAVRRRRLRFRQLQWPRARRGIAPEVGRPPSSLSVRCIPRLASRGRRQVFLHTKILFCKM